MFKFITSLTLAPSDIRKITGLLTSEGLPLSNYLDNILVTPLFVAPESLKRIHELKSQYGTKVMFDSGGYYVQIGRLNYSELYYPLLQFYTENDWADIYTLPDHVPTSLDSEDEVWQKVEDTVRYSTLFYNELPPHLQHRAMAVVQGHTYEQVDRCLSAYLQLGVRHIGFGSFGTFGQKKEVNVATNQSVNMARYVVEVAKKYQIKVHFFGLGAPALVAMIYGCGASSFDSSSWIKAAGFGQVFLPFMRAYNISHRNGKSELQRGITIPRFKELSAITQHSCPFCTDIGKLQQYKMYRTVHNLIVTRETVDIISTGKLALIKHIYKQGSIRYREEYEKWLLPT